MPTPTTATGAASPREAEGVLPQEESGYDSDQTPRSNTGDPGGCGSSPGSSRSSVNSGGGGGGKEGADGQKDNGEQLSFSYPSKIRLRQVRFHQARNIA